MNEPGDGLLGRERVKALLEGVLRRSSAEQMEAVLIDEHSALTRFADSSIHQNVADHTPRLSVRAVIGRRVGTASTARLDDAGIAGVVERAEAFARVAPEDAHFPGLPAAGSATQVETAAGQVAFSSETARSSPATRADLAALACRMAREHGLGASGAVTTTGQEIAVANTHGIFTYTPRSLARISVVAVGPSGSGYAEEHALDLSTLDMEAIAARACATGRRAQDPIAVPPGEYTVILQPEAVADMTTFLAALGFGAQAVYEGRSFVAGKRGERVLGANVTLWDDGRDPANLPLPFDVEGTPRRRLTLIEHGVADAIATDSYYGALLGLESSGHAPLPTRYARMGPLPTHLFMAPGETTVDEMIRGVARGLLVTHFHYTRAVHPLHVIVTGMTRDGTFLIENGEVTRPVKNLRFTQSYLDALRDVQEIGRETRLVGEYVASRVPALKIGAFRFTGVTQ